MTAPLDPGRVADPASVDEILGVFLEYLTETGVVPYDHQEEAILEGYEGKNVILNTPTGSGKSLVALAWQFKSLVQGRRSFYTVPVKALANEKFLSLCRVFGPDRVGMMTGDATVNPSASIICCTAEILAMMALRHGSGTPVEELIMDEFHYYSDSSRGVAWQIPLLTLPKTRFLLMSATLGDTEFFERELSRLTGAPTVLVKSDQRPVPLEFEWSETPLEEKVVHCVESGKAPVYLVHFTQLACARTAQNLLSFNVCSREEKRRIAELLEGADFRSPYGREVSKLLRHGIGIHHAGMLPKYRILVEKLAQQGLLKVICGTDTLGVGVNVPIRSVMFTQLCKFDGKATRILTVRDFKQICGRAGRRGFDEIGYVIAQAPEHVIENLRMQQKPGKKNQVKRKPPEKGFVPWDEKTFRKLIESPPERLVSKFQMRFGMLLHVLSRSEEDGCRAMRDIIHGCHESNSRKKQLLRHGFRQFKALVQARVLKIVPIEQRTGPAKLTLNLSLQEDFTMNQSLGLYLMDAVGKLDRESPDYALNVISLVECILEDPEVILRKQCDQLRGELVAKLKDERVDYHERMMLLEEVEWPKPGKEFILATFEEFTAGRPWVADGGGVRPKSIAREMFEFWQSFEDYIKTYQLERSEGVLLRHLTEVCRVMSQTLPPSCLTPDLEEAVQFFEQTVRGVDSSLIDEWEQLRNPETGPRPKRQHLIAKAAFTRNVPAFTREVRHAVFNVVKSLSSGQYARVLELISPESPEGVAWDANRLEVLMDDYFREHQRIRLDPAARNNKHSHLRSCPVRGDRIWLCSQTLVDPEDWNDWAIEFEIPLDACDARESVVLTLQGIGPIATFR